MSPAQGEPVDDVSNQLIGLKADGLFRKRLIVESAQSGRIVVNNKEVLNFCSNDYLGLANNPYIIKAFQGAAEKYGVGSGASPLVCGRSTAHSELEEEVARITGRDKAIIFSSGYLANLAIVSTFAPDRGDVVFQDKLNHASMIDGAVLSRARLVRYPHVNTEALGKAVSQKPSGRKLVLTDSIFSMDGDMAPIEELANISEKAGARFGVDDAHGFGVFGSGGAGVLDELHIGQNKAPLMMATFGKAIGCAGAFVSGQETLIELLIQKARPYIYSTALAPALAVAATQGLRMLSAESWRRDHLKMLISRFQKCAGQAGLSLTDSNSPIQPLLIGSASETVAMSERLLNAGILVTAIRPPTVPGNTSRLRITFSANHKEEDIDILVDRLSKCLAEANKKL
jgi:8-amino-7-oxononanoate synthase